MSFPLVQDGKSHITLSPKKSLVSVIATVTLNGVGVVGKVVQGTPVILVTEGTR